MYDLYLIMPGKISNEFSNKIKNLLENLSFLSITDTTNIPNLKDKKILFAIELDECGFNISLFEIFKKLYSRGNDSLLGSSAIIIINSINELYTKNSAQNIIFLANQIGCRFPGHCIVESTKTLNNLLTWQKKINKTLDEIHISLCKNLINNFLLDTPTLISNPKILILHSSSHKTSNTLMLWNMTKTYLPNNSIIKEYHVENGTIVDCNGCSYTICNHYSKKDNCFYGGVVTKELLPEIEKADCIIWLCPNYNDAISAKLMAIINRLTVLYKKMNFHDKTFFSIIVSGNSGSDSVAKQLIGALNINKGFRLPPYFSLSAIANDPESIKNVDNIEEKAKQFAIHLLKEIKKS